MKTIIDIDQNSIIIGDAKDNSIITVNRNDCKFEPVIGDQVNIFQGDSRLIVTKKSESEPLSQSNMNSTSSAGKDNFHINITNDNSHKNDGYSLNNNNVNQLQLVDKTTYLLLAFFLGGIGGHKFYANKIGLGVVYLIFSLTFIPMMIALIEFFVALGKQPDSQGRILV